MQGGLTYEHGQLAINAAAKLLGADTEKRRNRIMGEYTLESENKNLLKTCETVLKPNNKQKNTVK
jgi:hypothetical protein